MDLGLCCGGVGWYWKEIIYTLRIFSSILYFLRAQQHASLSSSDEIALKGSTKCRGRERDPIKSKFWGATQEKIINFNNIKALDCVVKG